MTPAEILLYAEKYAERQRQTAYLQGLITRAMIISGLNGKPAPSYEAIFDVPKTENEPMDDLAMFRRVMMLNQAAGGDDHFEDKGVS